jgi:rhodanese-related sulfurtransferase
LSILALVCIALINLTWLGYAVIMPVLLLRRTFVEKVLLLVLLWIPALVLAAPTPSVCHNELSGWIKAQKPLAIVDIQDPAEFHAHNYEHSLAAGRDPKRLKKIARRLRATQGKVVLVSSTGGADAGQAAERLVLAGVRRSRILVLEGGMEAAARNATCDCCKPAALQQVSQ